MRNYGLIVVGLAIVLGGCSSTAKHHPPVLGATNPNTSSSQSSSQAPSTPPASTPASTPTSTPSAHTSTPVSSAPHTTRVVLRPVTAKGYPAPGYTVAIEATGQVNCGPTAEASPNAVDDDILQCSPDAEFAVACWHSHSAGYVLCLRDPWSKKLVQIPESGAAKAAAPAKPTPLGMTLSNGTRCTIRDGGAWNGLAGHPGWYGTYYCNQNEAVWGKGSAYGIDVTHPLWSATTAPLSGKGALVTHTVTTAYFVGTLAG